MIAGKPHKPLKVYINLQNKLNYFIDYFYSLPIFAFEHETESMGGFGVMKHEDLGKELLTKSGIPGNKCKPTPRQIYTSRIESVVNGPQGPFVVQPTLDTI